MELPQSFAEQMKTELGSQWDAFVASYEEKACRGYRINQTKAIRCLDVDLGDGSIDIDALGLSADPAVDWCVNGRYLTDDTMSKDPLHFAGAYYIQEPSAMLPAALLGAKPGDRVLDLCAAPGGKSTQLLDDMRDQGLLVSNDISASRAKAIVKNVERFGFGHVLVTAESPNKLAAVFPEYFDKILVDAPCSGEGMFRREPSMREEWLRKGPDFYQPLQREILTQAVQMLRPGGRLVYSTCTFCLAEDEDNAAWLQENYPQMHLIEDHKIMPHTHRGEGQYAALFEKQNLSETMNTGTGEDGKYSRGESKKTKDSFGNFKEKGNESVLDFFKLIKKDSLGEKNSLKQSDVMEMFAMSQWYLKDDQLYALPVDIGPMKKIRFLRTGLLLGECKKGRFEPSQALAMYLNGQQFVNTVEFSRGDERVIRYLKGETIEADGALHRGKNGWCLVLMDGLPLGWAKRTGETLKNKYEPGWRMQ